MREPILKRQIIPVFLTLVVCAALIVVLRVETAVLNLLTKEDIILQIRPLDIIIGLTIYLKTSIDFAIFMAHLMDANGGWKSRISIEIGTALGNAAGTLAVLLIWTFFKEVRVLLALMIFLAALVLFRLAEDGLEHAKDEDKKYPSFFRKTVSVFEHFLEQINRFIVPILNRIIPNIHMKSKSGLKFWPLFGFSFTVPFILGMDDFAGYVPLFSVVNVFGFAIGVFAGHMALNMLLYLSPDRTIKAVKNPVISFIGSVAFVGLAVWGLVEVVRLVGAR